MNKKLIKVLSIFSVFFVIVATLGLIIQHQQKVQKEVNSSLTRSIDFNDEYMKEIAAAEAVVEKAAQYSNHQSDSNYANEIYVPLEMPLNSEEMAFVSDLNAILKTKDVHSFVNLFKHEEYIVWLKEQNIKQEPEQYLLAYLQECMSGIKAFNYYQRAGEHYIRITFKDGQVKNSELAIVPEKDSLRFSLSFDEFKDYIS